MEAFIGAGVEQRSKWSILPMEFSRRAFRYARRVRFSMSDVARGGVEWAMMIGPDERAVEAALWLRFAERFLDPRSYLIGAGIAFALGDDGVRAVVMQLRRAEKRYDGRERLACNEAANILEGALHDLD